jgi:hypothetical protein
VLHGIKAFFAFWYDFLVGDDIVVAIGAVVAVVATVLLVDNGVNAWWLMPIAAALLLVESMWRAERATRRRRDPDG